MDSVEILYDPVEGFLVEYGTSSEHFTIEDFGTTSAARRAASEYAEDLARRYNAQIVSEE